MKFLIVDDSNKQDNRFQKYFFLLCGAIVDEKNLLLLNNELETYKNKNNLTNLKDIRKTRIDVEKKLIYTRSIFEILQKFDLRVMAAILGPNTMNNEEDLSLAYDGCVLFLMERFFLQLKKESGLIILDDLNLDMEKRIGSTFYQRVREESLVMFGDKKGEYKDVLFPSLLFSNDQYNCILQAVDLIAVSLNNALWKSYKRNGFISEIPLSSENPYISTYWPLFIASASGKIDGWGIKIWN